MTACERIREARRYYEDAAYRSTMPWGDDSAGRNIFVTADDGTTHFVASRDSAEDARKTADIYNADPIQSGTFFTQ